MNQNEHHRKTPPHEAILLSQTIKEKKEIRFTFIDGDVLIERVRWHTEGFIGLRDGKVVNKMAVKYWELMD